MTGSIQDMYNNIKRIVSEDVYFYTLLIVMVSILSFGLGRLSVENSPSTPQPRVVLTEQPAAAVVSGVPTEQKTPVDAASAQVVASKKGTKYHLLTCPGVKQMNEDNKVYFNSEAEAKAAGYSRAKNCKF